MGDHGLASCLSYRQDYLNPDPIRKAAYGPPPPRMARDRNDNEPRTMSYLDGRRTEIDRARTIGMMAD
jgi:hypothetical protein